jgi:hypothetical protein
MMVEAGGLNAGLLVAAVVKMLDVVSFAGLGQDPAAKNIGEFGTVARELVEVGAAITVGGIILEAAAGTAVYHESYRAGQYVDQKILSRLW